jgi:hypothetical protein
MFCSLFLNLPEIIFHVTLEGSNQEGNISRFVFKKIALAVIQKMDLMGRDSK